MGVPPVSMTRHLPPEESGQLPQEHEGCTDEDEACSEEERRRRPAGREEDWLQSEERHREEASESRSHDRLGDRVESVGDAVGDGDERVAQGEQGHQGRDGPRPVEGEQCQRGGEVEERLSVAGGHAAPRLPRAGGPGLPDHSLDGLAQETVEQAAGDDVDGRPLGLRDDRIRGDRGDAGGSEK